MREKNEAVDNLPSVSNSKNKNWDSTKFSGGNSFHDSTKCLMDRGKVVAPFTKCSRIAIIFHPLSPLPILRTLYGDPEQYRKHSVPFF